MALTINTNIVNDAGGYLLDTRNVKAGENSGEMVMLDEYLREAETVVASKETAMAIYTEIPAGGELVSNGHYTLSADQDLAVSLPTGSTADDMIYLSVLATGSLRIVISGSNYAPATDIRLSDGDFAELVATWQPQPVTGKWLLASRVVIGA